MDEPFSEPTIPGATEHYYPGRKMFGGRFVLQRRIGRGGMGEVWLARDGELGRDVALKFAPAEVANDPKSVAELRREVIAGLELSHPRIARVHDLQVADGEAAISMEYVAGKSLSDLQAETAHGFFEPEEIAGWVDDVIDALEYAHDEAQRTHRDVKPKNILVDAKTGRAKLVDFGISKRLSDSFTRNTGKDSSGSLAYMSGQQLRGEMTAAADDWYSLGATVYELLTGAPPFFQGDLRTQIEKVAPPTMMERRRVLVGEMIDAEGEAIPQKWEDWVAGLLAKDREGREAWLGKPGAVGAVAVPPVMPPPVAEPAAVEPAGPPAPEPVVGGRSSRVGWIAAVVLLLMAVLGVGGWIGVTMMDRDESPDDPLAAVVDDEAARKQAELDRVREEKRRLEEKLQREEARATELAAAAEEARREAEAKKGEPPKPNLWQRKAEEARAAAERREKELEAEWQRAEEERVRLEAARAELARLAREKEAARQSKVFRVVYTGSDGVSFRSGPAGALWANMYVDGSTARFFSTGGARSAGGLVWEPVVVEGWMVEFNGKTGNRYIRHSGGAGQVVWSSGIEKENNVSLRAGPGVGNFKIGDVFKGAQLEVLDTAQDSSYRWVKVRLRGWMAQRSPKGTELIRASR